MDRRELDNTIQAYAKVVVDYLSPVEIILYGSQARGQASADSDIDIAIIVDSLQEDILLLESDLYRLGIEIDDRIEPLVFEEGHDPSGFLRHVRRTGRIVYRRLEGAASASG